MVEVVFCAPQNCVSECILLQCSGVYETVRFTIIELNGWNEIERVKTANLSFLRRIFCIKFFTPCKLQHFMTWTESSKAMNVKESIEDWQFILRWCIILFELVLGLDLPAFNATHEHVSLSGQVEKSLIRNKNKNKKNFSLKMHAHNSPTHWLSLVFVCFTSLFGMEHDFWQHFKRPNIPCNSWFNVYVIMLMLLKNDITYYALVDPIWFLTEIWK